MTKQRFNSRTVLMLSTLAACLAATTAHAGVLGSGSASLGGAVGPRSLDIGGQSRAGLQRDAAALPSGDKLRAKAGAVKDEAGRIKDAAVAKGGQMHADTDASARASAQQANAQGNAQASRDAGLNQAAGAKASSTEKLREGFSSAAATGATGSAARGDASVSGAAKVSRADRSANATVSGDASVGR